MRNITKASPIEVNHIKASLTKAKNMMIARSLTKAKNMMIARSLTKAKNMMIARSLTKAKNMMIARSLTKVKRAVIRSQSITMAKKHIIIKKTKAVFINIQSGLMGI
ncbi:hypothetical protein PJ311_05385 [Bacillus sp. CLL-7-23]|uniref:Uncharacterized protein n=1 Tax=Bacillus changyiensis TaxID=3004103 RepID=A0ABT4X3N8_9BACI|nr:hypothetical protein [Bacillus changyiensis]MDA7026046.1 hypothetical protein [Bacillus changyiensis]